MNQIDFLKAKLKSYENDFILHSKLLEVSLGHEDDGYVVNEKVRAKMQTNWEKKRDYLNHEIRKYQRYLLALSEESDSNSVAIAPESKVKSITAGQSGDDDSNEE